MLDLAQNKEKIFKHGWFVVRNKTRYEADKGIGPVERDEREQAFFRQHPFTELPQERRGTQALKRYLADLLCNRIQKAFPNFLNDIQKLLGSTKRELTSMATARNTVETKRSYLTKIARDFEKLASQSIRGRYDSLLKDDMKLRMKVREANDKFAHEMRSYGHTVPFLSEIAEATKKPGPNGNIQTRNAMNPDGGLSASLESIKVRPPRPRTFLIPFQAPEFRFNVSEQIERFQAISSMDSYQKYSFEELRLKEYAQDNFTSSTSNQRFNEPIQASRVSLPKHDGLAVAKGAFGDKASNSNVFGASTHGSIFGQSKPAVGGLFGAPTSGSTSSQPKPAVTGVFGGMNTPSPSLFGTPQASGFLHAGLFGKPETSITGAFSMPSEMSAIPGHREDAPSNDLFSSLRANPPTWNGGFFPSKPTKQNSDIHRWIRDEIKASRGTELQGTLNPDVLPILFHKQARKWGKMSEAQFLTIGSFTTKILTEVLRCVCTDEITRQRIEPMIRKASQESLDRGSYQLSRRMETILSKHLQTSNPAFERKISDARLARFQAALERYRLKHKMQSRPSSSSDRDSGHESGVPDDQLLVIDMRDTALLFAELHMSNSQNLQDEVHDTLKAYYEIAREDFVEYVNQHVVEAYLDDPRGPVLFFDPLHVAGMSNEEIESLAAEDEGLVKRRASREEAIVRLSRAREIAERYTG